MAPKSHVGWKAGLSKDLLGLVGRALVVHTANEPTREPVVVVIVSQFKPITNEYRVTSLDLLLIAFLINQNPFLAFTS